MVGQLQHSAPIGQDATVTIFVPIAPARTAAWQSLRRELVPLALADLFLMLMLWGLVWYLVLRPVARLDRFARQTSLEVPALALLPAAGFHGELAGCVARCRIWLTCCASAIRRCAVARSALSSQWPALTMASGTGIFKLMRCTTPRA